MPSAVPPAPETQKADLFENGAPDATWYRHSAYIQLAAGGLFLLMAVLATTLFGESLVWLAAAVVLTAAAAVSSTIDLQKARQAA